MKESKIMRQKGREKEKANVGAEREREKECSSLELHVNP